MKLRIFIAFDPIKGPVCACLLHPHGAGVSCMSTTAKHLQGRRRMGRPPMEPHRTVTLRMGESYHTQFCDLCTTHHMSQRELLEVMTHTATLFPAFTAGFKNLRQQRRAQAGAAPCPAPHVSSGQDEGDGSELL